VTVGTPAFLMTTVSLSLLGAVNYADSFWSVVYLLRTFYSDPQAPGHILRSLSGREEVAFFAIAAGVGKVAGVMFGGWLSDRWRVRDPRGRIVVIALSMLLYLPLLGVLFTTSSLWIFYVCWPLTAAAGQLFWPASNAALQDMVQPGIRARASAIAGVVNALLGFALGPYLAGKVAAVTGSVRMGMFSLFLISPAVLWMLWRTSRQFAFAETTSLERARGGAQD
jgi:MFS family permease